MPLAGFELSSELPQTQTSTARPPRLALKELGLFKSNINFFICDLDNIRPEIFSSSYFNYIMPERTLGSRNATQG